MKKSKNIKIPRQEMIEEHKRLVKVLKSKAHSDDVAEAKKQEKELNEYIRGTDEKGNEKE